LKIELAVAEKVTASEGAEQLAGFLEKLAGFPKLVTGVLGAPGEGARARALAEARGPADVEFDKKLTELSEKAGQPVITPGMLRQWIDEAVGQTAVARIANEMAIGADSLVANSDFTMNLYSSLLSWPASELSPATQALQALLRVSAVERTVAEKRALARSLGQLAKRLAEVGKAEKWVGGMDYLFYEVAPQADKIVTATVTARTLRYDLADGALSVGSTTYEKQVALLGVREHSSLIPEVAAGLIVSNVRTPRYGTSQSESGQTVVTRLDDEKVDYSGALLLNGVCRCFGAGAFAQPMLQFGIGGGESTPSFLGGVGFRFTRPKRLALSAGAILAWVKDLDKLAPGDPVSGTADLENDLKLHATVKAYFALQYSF
jgi:hypothetical protein